MSSMYPVFPGINDDLGAVLICGYTGPCSLPAESRRRAREAFRLRDAELALSLLAAELMELKIDETFFPGTLPADTQETVFSLGVLPSDPGEGINYLTGRAVLRGRSSSRGQLTEKWGRFLTALPFPGWVTVNSNIQQNAVTFCRITPEKGSSLENINCRGADGFSIETVLEFTVCITPPEPVFT